jgi:hypothetical protein
VNILEARVELRDRTVVDVVDLTLRFFMRHSLAYAKLSAIVLTPSFLLTWWIAFDTGSWGWAWIWALAIAPFAASPFTVLASRLMFEPRAEMGEILKTSLTALPRMLAVRFLQAIGVAFGAIAFLLPATWFLALFLFTNEVVVLERASVSGALSRMQRLLSGGSGDAILAVLFLLALHIMAVFLGDLVGRGILEDVLEIAPPPSILVAKGSTLGLAAFWWFVPFAATCRFLLYVNVRTRNEGWDVQTRFAAIAARAEEA